MALDSFFKVKKGEKNLGRLSQVGIKELYAEGPQLDCPNFFACILNVNLEKLKPDAEYFSLMHLFVKFTLDMKWTKIL